MRQTVRRVSILFIVGAATYLVALWSFRVQLIHLLYGGKYLEYDGVPVLLAGLMPFATACVVPLGSALRACERPDNVFWGYLGGAIAAVSVGLLLAFTWGVVGALIGNLVSYGAVISVFWFFYRKAEPQGTPA